MNNAPRFARITKGLKINNRPIGAAAVGLTALIAAGAVAAGLSAPAASASPSTTTLALTYNASYACVGPCVSATYFWFDGEARSGSTTWGRVSAVGTVLSVLSNGCLAQSEHWALTEQTGPDNGDTIWLSTASDRFCPTKNPNISIETGSLIITGGTGAFKGATGGATFRGLVLGHPQTGSTTLTVSISY
jgi:hypothetical protein